MTSAERIQPRRALLSVSDKTGLIELAQALLAAGVELISTGGTASTLRQANLPVHDVAALTGFPEIMDGRVKTLHPKVHGGLLGRRGQDDAVMAQHGIQAIDVLIVNLYPFEKTIAQKTCTYADAIENIDIGGPAMLRAAAKNHAHVCVVTDPNDYPRLVSELNAGGTTFAWRQQLAAKAYAHTGDYDTRIAQWFSHLSSGSETPFPPQLSLSLPLQYPLRYGENPHQSAAFYRDPATNGACIGRARLSQGKALSFNNLADADTAVQCVRQFMQPACVIVKHANPCGVAVAADDLAAYEQAYRLDPTSAFGGIIAFNCPVAAQTLHTILERQFVEVLIAPEWTPECLALAAKKPNVRVLSTGDLRSPLSPGWELRSITGGVLVQTRDDRMIGAKDLSIVTQRAPTDSEMQDLLFAWAVCKYVKSNAIVFARDGSTLGIGAGQMSRVVSSRIAVLKAQDAGLSLAGGVMASDAFLPFRDGLDVAADNGLSAVIQPGGSLRDAEVIAAANDKGIAMVFTGVRHFRH
jgi:phosphoribosylaminoimidazolecarboxamide formyltransferase / IMP cyclohydrolase